MNIKFSIINTDYPEFTHWLYSQNKGLKSTNYEEQLKVRMDSLFGVADFYSKNFKKLGHEADDIIVNNEILQKQWAKENGLVISGKERIYRSIYQIGKRVIKKIPFYPKPALKSFFPAPVFPGFYQILSAQIKKIHPDVIFNQAVGGVGSNFSREMKPYYKLLVGQIASPLPKNEDFKGYDLMLSCLPNFVNHFRKLGVRSEYHRLGFEPTVLERLKQEDKIIPISFIGGLSHLHKKRMKLLEYLCKETDIKIWGYGVENLPTNSLTREHYISNAWGLDMYQILKNSKITINQHGDIAGDYAVNMRLYEATGVGTLLITDHKDNLSELFIPGKEVVAYHSPEECVELIKYYLEHDEERERIAKAGQQRTLKEHTYYQRMQELVEIIKRYL